MRQFRINAKRFFLTFPQTETTPEEALGRLLEREDVEWVVVAQEEHKEEGLHLHIAVEFSKKRNVTRQDYFDYVTGSHGNYQGMRNLNRTLEYITKDGCYLEHGIDVKSKLKAAKSRSSYGFEVCAKEIQSGKSVYDIAKEHPGFVCANRIKLIGFQNWWSMETIGEPATTWQPVKVHAMNRSMFAVHNIVKWLNENIKCDRLFKQKQLWIHGPPNTGKTSMITFLSSALRIYMFPHHDRWCDGYVDGKYDLAVFDEYKADRRLTWMNQWLQGGPFSVEVKNSFVLKRQNIPTIILSNFSPEECYHKSAAARSLAFDAFKSRLVVVHVEAWCQLDWAPVEDEVDVPTKEICGDDHPLTESAFVPVGGKPSLHQEIGKPLPKLDDIIHSLYSSS